MKHRWQKFVPMAAGGMLLGLAFGCGGTDVQLAKEPERPVDKIVKAEELPKEQQPAKGGSSGMNYAPGKRPMGR